MERSKSPMSAGCATTLGVPTAGGGDAPTVRKPLRGPARDRPNQVYCLGEMPNESRAIYLHIDLIYE